MNREVRMKKILLAALLLPSLALGDVVLKSGVDTTTATVDSSYNALRVTVQPRTKNCYAAQSTTGIVGAALASGAAVFALRMSPAAGKTAYVYKVTADYTTQVAYTTPLSAIRRLGVFRGSGAATSGGTSLDTFVIKKDPAAANSAATIALGGDVRISSTGALTITGITWEVGPFAEFFLGASATGAAGGTKAFMWTPGEDTNTHAIELEPGQVLAVRAGALFDAAGTWVGSIGMEWCEY